MATLQLARTRPSARTPRRAFLHELDGQSPFASVGPNWFASVMGTGIVANAAATLPAEVPGLAYAARAVWVLAALLLVVVAAATAAHWRTHPLTARGHLDDPVMSHFHGAPAMALMTVGAGALLVGAPVVGPAAALALFCALWTAGTLLGLWTAFAIPRRMTAARRYDASAAGGAWLMPVVPPMVSAATGPLLVPHLPTDALRVALLLACAAMFGVALLASTVVTVYILRRLLRHGVGPAAAVPTLWIVLGFLGQSVTAAHTVSVAGSATLPASWGRVLEVAAVVYGVPVWGLAMLWLAIVAALTARTVRSPGGLPFSLAWWSFTFPVGTVVTGTSALVAGTGSTVLGVAAAVLYAALVTAWLTVAVRTASGVHRGGLLRAPG